MSETELSALPSKSVIELALYYDFILYNMQQKPFGVLLAIHGGAIRNIDRIIPMNTDDGVMIKIDPITFHNELLQCLKLHTQCNTYNLEKQVNAIKKTYNDKIDEFKRLTKTTPAELYDLLNPGEGKIDINAAIQNAARTIMAYAPSQQILYLGDDVFDFIIQNAASQFLTDDTVAAMSSIMAEAKLPPKRKGGRRGTRRRGPKRHNRRSYKNKNKKRTRRH